MGFTIKYRGCHTINYCPGTSGKFKIDLKNGGLRSSCIALQVCLKHTFKKWLRCPPKRSMICDPLTQTTETLGKTSEGKINIDLCAVRSKMVGSKCRERQLRESEANPCQSPNHRNSVSSFFAR